MRPRDLGSGSSTVGKARRLRRRGDEGSQPRLAAGGKSKRRYLIRFWEVMPSDATAKRVLVARVKRRDPSTNRSHIWCLDVCGAGPGSKPATVDQRTVTRYVSSVIRSFADKETAAIFSGRAVRNLPHQIQARARAKLLFIDAAKRLSDLRVPPSNHLEALGGDRKGQHSIRINKQWRICFRWQEGDAWSVEVTDYH
jgi:proteic killer suppression protein